MQGKEQAKAEKFVFSDAERAAIEAEKKHYEDSHAVSIEALKIVQKERGWVCDGAVYAIAEILEISPSDVEGVATFYNQIFRQPVGRHIIRYCDSVVCYINNFEAVKKAFEAHLHLKPGETTPDGRFTLLPTCCLGNCDRGPSVMIDEDLHCHVTPESIPEMLEPYK